MLSKLIEKLLGSVDMSPSLVSAIFAYLILTPLDAIIYLQWINTMQNYKFIAGALIFPLIGFFFFLVPTIVLLKKKEIISFLDSWCYVNPVTTFITEKIKKTKGIKPHTLNYPVFDLGLIGSMDSGASTMSALAIPNISIMLNVIISKLVLPLTMASSYIFLGKKYFANHYFGVFLTMFGIIVAAIPKLIMGGGTTNIGWLVLFIFSLFPGVGSFLIKESYLKRYKDANAWYMNSVISLFQIGIGILSLILVKLPIKGIYVDDFGLYVKNSLACQFGGVNSMEGDNCKYSFLYLMIFQIFGTIANILMFFIIERSSSVTFIMFNTLKTPTVAFCGFFLIYYNVISYTKEESFVITWLDVVSLILVVIGSIFYALKKEIEPDYGQQNNEKNDLTQGLTKGDYFSIQTDEEVMQETV